MEKQAPVLFYAEMTPNPLVMKFVCDKNLIQAGASAEYTKMSETSGSALAAALFQFPYVQGVFISSNFVSVTRNPTASWDDVMNELREFLRQFMAMDIDPVAQLPMKEVFSDSSFSETLQVPTQHNPPGNETEQKIVEVLDQYVRPAVESDGGLITFISFINGRVTVQLRGACSGCPSSSVTLKSGIEALLKRMVPGVEEVVAELPRP
ncbi:MAG: NifU family protein [Bacteroidia bacterium]|nr:NifU family protein [Bacteroidia bacterium]